jgi:hypothetical protein
MSLIIRDPETKHLAAEVAFLMGETETAAIQLALREALDRRALGTGPRRRPTGDLRRLLESEIWPLIPEGEKGQPPIARAEWEEILGTGSERW